MDGFCQKKCHTKEKKKKRKEKERKSDTLIEPDGVISQFQNLPIFDREVPYFTTCWLGLIFHLNILYDVIHKWVQMAAACPKNAGRENNHMLSLPICQEEISKVILGSVYELENNLKIFIK